MVNDDDDDKWQDRRRKSVICSIIGFLEKALCHARVDWEQFWTEKTQVGPGIWTQPALTGCRCSTTCTTCTTCTTTATTAQVASCWKLLSPKSYQKVKKLFIVILIVHPTLWSIAVFFSELLSLDLTFWASLSKLTLSCQGWPFFKKVRKGSTSSWRRFVSRSLASEWNWKDPNIWNNFQRQDVKPNHQHLEFTEVLVHLRSKMTWMSTIKFS